MFLWCELLGLGTRFCVNNEAETFSGRGSGDFSDMERVDVLHAGLKEPWEGTLDVTIHRCYNTLGVKIHKLLQYARCYDTQVILQYARCYNMLDVTIHKCYNTLGVTIR